MGKLFDTEDEKVDRIDELLEQTNDLDLVLKRLRMTPEEREADRAARAEAQKAEEMDAVKPMLDAMSRAAGFGEYKPDTLEDKIDRAFSGRGRGML